MKIHEYQAQGAPREVRRAGAAGRRRASRADEAEAAAQASSAGRVCGRQGADPRRRPRQGRRRQARQDRSTRSRQPRRQMLGMQLVTHQTGPRGPEGQAPARRGGRRHRARALPRHASSTAPRRRVALMASTEGGMEIEEVAAKHAREDPQGRDRPGDGLQPCQAPQARLRPRPRRAPGRKRATSSCTALYQRVHRDATRRWSRSTRWSSPSDGDVLALDAKINFDDNALFRHPELGELRDLDEEDPAEIEAKQARPQLHLARRQHRLHGQRRRPRDGDDGHHQALRRRAGQLPRRRRRRHRGAGDRGVQDHPRATRR